MVETAANAKRKRILVIEDDYTNRLLFVDYLTSFNYVVLSLPDGLDLLSNLKNFRPDLILLDLGLPEVDGYNLLRQLQASEQWSRIPVVVVSGYAFEADRTKALNLGARNFLTKPVRLRELMRVIERTLTQTSGDE